MWHIAYTKSVRDMLQTNGIFWCILSMYKKERVTPHAEKTGFLILVPAGLPLPAAVTGPRGGAARRSHASRDPGTPGPGGAGGAPHAPVRGGKREFPAG